MATCPKCGNRVPRMAIWTGYGLSGVICPHCNASLKPTYLGNFLLLFVSMALGILVRTLLSQAGVGWPWDLVGWIATLSASYALLMTVFIRLQPKTSG